MKIAIIGTGNIGGTLARLWMNYDHKVSLGLRNKDKFADTMTGFPGAQVQLTREAAAQSEAVLLAVPWSSLPAVLHDIGDLSGKLVMDATNPIRPDFTGLEPIPSGSVAEMIQVAQPQAHVVKAFNTLGADYLGNAQVGDTQADGFYCGDDADANAIAARLITQAGLLPVDSGSLREARYLETMAMLWIDMAFGVRRNQRFAFKLLIENAPPTRNY